MLVRSVRSRRPYRQCRSLETTERERPAQLSPLTVPACMLAIYITRVRTPCMGSAPPMLEGSHARARSALRWCPCASCIWLLHPAPILVPKMVLTLCNLRWWCFCFHQLVKILHLQSWWSSPAATCAGGVFPWRTSAFT